MAAAARLRFITSDICPFAHRAWLVLREVGADFEKVDVTLTAGKKEAYFTEIYRRALGANVMPDGSLSDGKVPVIEDAGFVLCESAVVAAYVDETRGGGRLSGADAKERAAIAIFNEQVGGPVMQKFYPFLMAQTPEAQAAGRAAFEAALSSFDKALAARGGPFAMGERLTLADTNVWPFVLRAMVVLGHYREWALDAARFPHAQRFVDAMRALPSVQATTVDPKVFIEGYAQYANGGKN